MTEAAQSIESAMRDGAGALRRAGIEAPRAEARRLLAHALGWSREALLREARTALDDAAIRCYQALIARRAAAEPFAYLTSEREFWSLAFEVTPATLIPRPESETLIELALSHATRMSYARAPHGAPRMLDLGTGSGCLLLALLSELPEAHGIGVDVSLDALHVAARNAAHLGLDARARFVCGSWGSMLGGRFDLIVANPPYVATRDAPSLPPDVARFEPSRALYAGPDGLAAYRALTPDLARLLAPGGVAVLELGAGAAGSVATIAAACGLVEIERRRDLAGIERAAAFRLNATIR